ncbi:MAG: HNH endonuclease [Thermoplasmataceae archaeon]|jgi:hypothetical protein
MKIPNIYSEIPRVSPAAIDQIGRHFGFENASDFDPLGDKTRSGIPWKRISEAVLVRDSYSCRSCGKSTFTHIANDNSSHSVHLSVQVHHIIPRKDGGSDSFRNLITLCEDCHHSTFSNDYAGLPSKEPSLSVYNSKYLLVIPDSFLTCSERATKTMIHDYARTYDTETGTYMIRPKLGESMELSVLLLTFDRFRSIGKEFEKEYLAGSYVKIKQSGLSNKILTFFVDNSGNLIG